MADQPGSTRPTFDATTGIDWIYATKNGVTGKIFLTELQKLVGGSGNNTGSSGGNTGSSTSTAVNLFTTPNDLSGANGSKFTDYQPNGELTKPNPLHIVCKNGSVGPDVIYEEISTSTLKAGSQYTVGATVTRAAGSGTGKVRANVYFVGPNTNFYAQDQTVSDGVAYRTSYTFTVPATGTTATHAGFDFTPGGGDFTFSNVTVVAGATDNPNAGSSTSTGTTSTGTTNTGTTSSGTTNSGATNSGTGTSTGSTGGTTTGTTTQDSSKNIFSTPNDLSADGQSKFFDYQPNGELSRPGGMRLVVKAPFTGPVLLSEQIANTVLIPGQLYTLGFSFIRAANTGSGVAYAHVDWHENGNASSESDPAAVTVTDGQSARVTLTFRVPSGVGNSFAGIRFNGACDLTFSNVTLVSGSTDNPAAT